MQAILMFAWLANAPPPSHFADEAASLARYLNETKTRLHLQRSKLSTLSREASPRPAELARGDATLVIMGDAPVLSEFRPLHCSYQVDGVQVFAGPPARAIFRGVLAPGVHTLTVEVVYEGHGGVVFSYLNGYRITARSGFIFRALGGQLTRLDVAAFDRGVLSDGRVGLSVSAASSPDLSRR